jgi:hypothetical protein
MKRASKKRIEELEAQLHENRRLESAGDEKGKP